MREQWAASHTAYLKAQQSQDVVRHDMLLLVAQVAGLHEGIDVHVWHDPKLALTLSQLLDLICRTMSLS